MSDYSDPEQIKKLSTMDPELEALLQKTTIPKTDWSNVGPMRAARAELERLRGPNEEEAKLESTKTIPMRDGYESEIRIHRPQSPPAKSPLVVLLFGGGFVVGSNKQLGPYARNLAKLYGATVVTVNYRLAPEHKFPIQAHDAWDSVEWIAKNASKLGADPSVGFVLGGVSAGANLTAVTAQKAIDTSLSPPLTGLWLSVPVLFEHSTVPEEYKHRFLSREQNADVILLNAEAISHVNKHLEPVVDSPEYSPFSQANAHKGLPPTFFQVCGMDPLRDDGLIYEEVLRKHGVKTKIIVYPGVPHAHFSFLPMLAISKKAVFDTIQNFGWLLNKEVPKEEIVKCLDAPGGA